MSSRMKSVGCGCKTPPNGTWARGASSDETSNVATLLSVGEVGAELSEGSGTSIVMAFEFSRKARDAHISNACWQRVARRRPWARSFDGRAEHHPALKSSYSHYAYWVFLKLSHIFQQ
jgi:hypothetical protein